MARKFGIEIEFGSTADLNGIAQVLYEANILSRPVVSPYTANDHTIWHLKRDASVRGGELVSPVLSIDSPEDRQKVNDAVMALRSAGAYTHESAGIHVHIDGNGMSAEQVAGVARIFTKFEDCIYRVATSGWASMRPEGKTYCKPLPLDRAQKIAKAKTLEQVSAAYYGMSARDAAYRAQSHGDLARYSGLNLHSWFYRKTIEFRMFNSSLNPERIQGYIGMCMALVQDSRNGAKRSVNAKRYPLGGMADGTTNEVNARHRFLQVLRYDGGMDVEDMKRLTKIWKDSRPQTRAACGG